VPREEFFHDQAAPPARLVTPSVFAAIRDPHGRLLLVRRLDNGNWELPGYLGALLGLTLALDYASFLAGGENRHSPGAMSSLYERSAWLSPCSCAASIPTACRSRSRNSARCLR
jgi:hypothetical protein